MICRTILFATRAIFASSCDTTDGDGCSFFALLGPVGAILYTLPLATVLRLAARACANNFHDKPSTPTKQPPPSTYIHTYILIDNHVPAAGVLGAFGALGRSRTLFSRFDWPARAGKKKNARLRARFSRFVARTWPPGLDFEAPGRSRARFWRLKRLDFRAFSSLPRVRC